MTLAALAIAAILQGGLDAKVQSVLPTAKEERWLQIPWRLNLMQARADAQASGKPIFMWIMNGHPMGCT